MESLDAHTYSDRWWHIFEQYATLVLLCHLGAQLRATYMSVQLEQWLVDCGYIIVVAPDSGDCVPICLSVFFTGEDQLSEDVRRLVAGRMCTDADDLTQTCPISNSPRDADEASSAEDVIIDSLSPNLHVGDHFISWAMKLSQRYCELYEHNADGTMSTVVVKFNVHLEGNGPALRLLRHKKIDGAGHASFHYSLLLERAEFQLVVERRAAAEEGRQRRATAAAAAARATAVDVERRAAHAAERARWDVL
jgi:hypothetical protein